jgi:flagellar motor switch/type III secretory pathway protein FliN
MATVLALPRAQEPGISEAAWREASWLPCRLTSEIAVAGFTVGDLMSIEVGSVVVTRTPTSSDVLVRVNGELIGRAELDAVGDRFAVRITEMA